LKCRHANSCSRGSVAPVTDKFSQKVAKKNEDSIANGVCLKGGRVPKTSLF
jgi:hypothetical protein